MTCLSFKIKMINLFKKNNSYDRKFQITPIIKKKEKFYLIPPYKYKMLG